jgi:hypothetical protein
LQFDLRGRARGELGRYSWERGSKETLDLYVDL